MTQDLSSSLPSRWAAPEQAKLLLDVGLRPALSALMAGALSAAELASKLGVDVQRAHYLLGKLTRAGVAEVASVQARAGRAIKRYRVHDDWYVPFEVTQAATLTELVQGQVVPRMAEVMALTVQSLYAWRQIWGVRLIGEHLTLLGPDGTSPFGGPPLFASIGGLPLTPERAAELQGRLASLITDFQDPAGPNTRPYTFGLFLTEGQTH